MDSLYSNQYLLNFNHFEFAEIMHLKRAMNFDSGVENFLILSLDFSSILHALFILEQACFTCILYIDFDKDCMKFIKLFLDILLDTNCSYANIYRL